MAKGTLALRQIQLGDNADTSKNFVISVPAVADGTLVIERGNGTDVLSIAADGKVTLTPTTEMTPLGVGQTWQDVSGSRVLSAIYTNTTGRPIQVCVTANCGPTGGTFLVVGGISVSTYQASNTAGVTNLFTHSVIVPARVTYQLVGSALHSWKELR